ncbi:hypothetical protein H5410_005949 [Solanum commersonii]|uniref:Uncharacterized protein n=1 Tax=Solanum commersonii TaxID=4109 RepID=A0A9J6A8X1_SOLCO|nr:hypothetical protein H5410_005949 [Solanum commersonii]
MDHPSFSIGITQIVTANTNRISDYEDPNEAENRSNRLHDPITMAKQSSKKSKPKKEAHGKTPKKRGRKVASAIYRSTLPTVEFVQDIMQQESDTVKSTSNLMIFKVTIFAQDMQHCYESMVSTKTEYVSENDDPTRPKSDYTPPTKDDLVNVE